VYPPAYGGQKLEPAFTGLLGAYYTGSASSDYFNSYPPRVQPGDTILIHAGLYKDDRYRYGAGPGKVLGGSYFLTQTGTAEKPLVMKAAGETDLAAEESRIKAAAEEDGRKIVESAEQEIAAAAKAARRDLTAYAADLAICYARPMARFFIA
jgi:hypothetical protein